VFLGIVAGYCLTKSNSEYAYVFEIIFYRLIFIAAFLYLMALISNLTFVKEVKIEFEIFNKPPKNMPFVVLLRKYRFLLLFLAALSYSLAVTFFLNYVILGNVLIIISVFCSGMYLYHFYFYVKNYIGKKDDRNL
jgi:hypothetical protein